MNPNILGIDIGGTTVKYAVLNRLTGQLGDRSVLPIASGDNISFIEQLAAIIAAPAHVDCDSVGIGSPGPLDLDNGTIIASANMPAIRQLALVHELTRRFPQRSIRLDNDANAATLGQKFFGAGQGLKDFAVFTLGTGVGGGCVFENRLQRGFKGNFFEAGHIPVAALHQTPRRCGCGNMGCLEAYASATGVTASYKEETGDVFTAQQIAERAAQGDEAAKRAYTLAASSLGIAAATITQLMNITDFIITGGMAAAEHLILPEMLRSYQEHTFALFHPLLQLRFTQGDENAGILGAAALFLE